MKYFYLIIIWLLLYIWYNVYQTLTEIQIKDSQRIENTLNEIENL